MRFVTVINVKLVQRQVFPGALAMFDACKMLDSSFHTEITLLRGSDGPRASPSRLLLSFTQEDKSLPHAQQCMITRICSTRDHTC